MSDTELEIVAAAIRRMDPTGERTARVLRDTLDQLYDGQRTGRYRWSDLHKTEKTHCGTLVEINLHREFEFEDGDKLDYLIEGIDVDCKYSQTSGQWTIPPEAHGHLCLLAWADDQKSRWSLGLVRITEDVLNLGRNRDQKATMSKAGRETITWLFHEAELPPNVLLHLPQPSIDAIFQHTGKRDGSERVRELFRVAQGMRVGRGVVATVAQQLDYMKRVRYNGGARTTLRPEGIIILGQYRSHQAVARDLGLPVPEAGESVSAQVTPAKERGAGVAEIDGTLWRLAIEGDPVGTAPLLPER